MAETIPAIDVARLNGSAAERLACAREIGRACEEIGFFHIVNHGVAADLRASVFDVARRFFATPLSRKMQVALSADSGFCGYFPLNGEVTDALAGADPKEGYDISLGAGAAGTRWAEEPAELRRILTAYYAVMADLGRTLSRGFALALDLPEDFFAAKLDRPTAILRLLHYPPGDPIPDPGRLPVSGCGAHSDYGYLTILAQDSQGGLQVETRARSWIDVPPVANAFVCNIGEMMALWTNNRFRATPHRVVRLAPAARFSVPFFLHPNHDVLIETLPTCRGAVAEGCPTAITSREYLHRRQTGAYV